MNIVFVGHVDHGKSTIVGRLLADTNSLPKGKLEALQADCARRGVPFEYAYLIDALKDGGDINRIAQRLVDEHFQLRPDYFIHPEILVGTYINMLRQFSGNMPL